MDTARITSVRILECVRLPTPTILIQQHAAAHETPRTSAPSAHSCRPSARCNAAPAGQGAPSRGRDSAPPLLSPLIRPTRHGTIHSIRAPATAAILRVATAQPRHRPGQSATTLRSLIPAHPALCKPHKREEQASQGAQPEPANSQQPATTTHAIGGFCSDNPSANARNRAGKTVRRWSAMPQLCAVQCGRIGVVRTAASLSAVFGVDAKQLRGPGRSAASHQRPAARAMSVRPSASSDLRNGFRAAGAGESYSR